MKQAQQAPFCDAPAARAAFDRWIQRLSALGLELSDADCFLIGTLAATEVTLTRLQAALAAAEGDDILKWAQATDRAGRAFLLALDRCQKEFEPRLAEAEEALPVAVGESRATPARVIPFVTAGSAENRVQDRIARALGAERLTKAELRTRVPGAQQVFLQALKALVAGGKVGVDGRGTRGFARRYFLRER